MEFDAPAVVWQIKDIKAIYEMNDIVNPVPDAEMLDKDLFTGTATRRGIERREKLYGLRPKDTDTLEERRFRVRAKENDRIPYTTGTLRKKLELLCGADGYSLDVTDDTVRVRVALTRKTMYEDVRDMLEKMIPLNMLIDCTLKYNQHAVLGKYTHAYLSGYANKNLRNEVLK